MVRKIIKPQSEEYLLHIPKEYIDTEVEILVLPMSDESTTSVLTLSQKEVLESRIKSFHEDRNIGRTWNDIKSELQS